MKKNINNDDLEIENLDIVKPKQKLPEKARKEYKEEVNEIFKPHDLKVIDKDEYFEMEKKAYKWTIAFALVSLILFGLFITNFFWFNFSIKDGKLQSTYNNPVNVNTPIYLNSSCYVNNNYTTINNINNYLSGYCNSSQTYYIVNQTLIENIIIINSTIINSSIINSDILNSTIN